jgi:hypothetical protein
MTIESVVRVLRSVIGYLARMRRAFPFLQSENDNKNNKDNNSNKHASASRTEWCDRFESYWCALTTHSAKYIVDIKFGLSRIYLSIYF